MGFLLFAAIASAQFYNGSQLSFGKNRVQYKPFLWQYQIYDAFDAYSYNNSSYELAWHLANYAPDQIDQIGRRLNAFLDRKIQFLVFSSLADLKQTNIGLQTEDSYNTGGVTHIIGSQVFVYYNGEMADFEKQIRAGIARFYVNQLIYGSSFTSQMKSSALTVMPAWYVDGLASYLAEDWNTTLDNRLKNAFLAGDFDHFNFIEGENAVLAGHSIWNFIAENYGDDAPGEIVNATKSGRSFETGLLYTIGLSYDALLDQWYNYYLSLYLDEIEKRPPPDGNVVLKGRKNKSRRVYSQSCVSADGKYVAYAANEIGKVKLWVQDIQSGKRKKLLKYGWKLVEKTDYHYPILRWAPSSQILALIFEHEGALRLRFYNISDQTMSERLLPEFALIHDFSFSPDAKHLLVSAEKNGQSDIFSLHLATGQSSQITNDVWDDIFPCILHDGKTLVFSSNRESDSLFAKPLSSTVVTGLNPNHDLFLTSFPEAAPVLKRITNTPDIDEIQPLAYEQSYFIYLSDENGIYNRFLAKLDSSIASVDTAVHYRYFSNSFPITDYNSSILSQNMVHGGKMISQVVLDEAHHRMLLMPKQSLDMLNPQRPTETFFQKMHIKKREVLNSEEPAVDTIEVVVAKKKVRFRNVQREEVYSEGDSLIGDINNYVLDQRFDSNKLKDSDAENKGGWKSPKQGSAYTFPYKPRFTIDELVTQVDFNFVNEQYQQFTGGGSPIYLDPGFNVFLKVGVTDLLQDYRITGGVRLAPDLRNNEYLLSYESLKNRLDERLVFHRRSLEEASIFSLVQQISHSIYYQLKWPFSPVLAVQGSFMLKNEKTVYLPTDDLNLKKPDDIKNWAGIKIDLTYDDTRRLGLNLYEGTRYKFFAEYNQLIDKSFENLMVFGFDIRNYLRIHRNFIWANRFACSTSLGSQRLIYYMGGVDRWLNAKFNNNTPIDQDQSYTYQTLATNMRGFDQNIRNGNSFAVINSELRFPVFKYFLRRPIRSDMMNNFQIVGFGDIGTAWTGLNPYSSDNALFTRWISQGPLLIKVEEQKEPIVAGTGLGMRTRLLGYFVRADVAWGYEDGGFNPPVWYFSLSLDF